MQFSVILLASFQASWENIGDLYRNERDTERDADWTEFANLLGYHELSRLHNDITYHLRPPGAM